MQVNVFDLPNYDLSQSQQEWLWLFSLIVAGKSAEFATGKLNDYLTWGWWPPGPRLSPFETVREDIHLEQLEQVLLECKTGQYKKLLKAFPYSVEHLEVHSSDLTIQDLEACPGCGPKTSRFFYMMTRRGARCAALDTHILKFLTEQPGIIGVPKSTPPAGKLYDRLENAFLGICDARGRVPAEFDLEIWKAYRDGRKVA